jgi:hypothetical protein
MYRSLRKTIGSDVPTGGGHREAPRRRTGDPGRADRLYRSWSINRSPNSVNAHTARTIMAPA